MNKLFYQRIAFINLQKNSNVYMPFVLTSIGTIIMFYNACALSLNSSTGDGQLAALMSLATVVTGIFSAIFLCYTNSFLLKRRKKEWGLYNILGMQKKHIAKISMWENIFVASFSIIIGIVIGIVFSKLFTLLLDKILKFPIKYGFEIDFSAIIITASCFLGIFIILLLNSIVSVYRSKPIELLYGTNVGEKEPKTNWIVAIIGSIALFLGYTLALTTQNPMKALPVFFIAVILVIIGTYCLFTAGSIALLKILKKNKKYYYQTRHFTAISGMIYRMRQNAVGLASICIMSTAVLVMVSTTVALYVGVDDILANRYRHDVKFTISCAEKSSTETEDISLRAESYMDNSQIPYKNYKTYTTLEFPVGRSGNEYLDARDMSNINFDEVSILVLISHDDYEKYTGEKIDILDTDEVAVYSTRKDDSIEIFGKTYKVKTQLENDPEMSTYTAYSQDMLYVVMPKISYVEDVYKKQLQIYGENASKLEFITMFDFDTSSEIATEFLNNSFTKDLSSGAMLGENIISYKYEMKHLEYDNFFIIYGGLFFLGIFLGFLFLMATVLIIYYKQVVEGFDDRKQFEIMQKIGMTHKEVMQSIKSQILTVFALPLAMAVIHICVAFPIITKLLENLRLINVSLIAICTAITILVFSVIYCLIYMLTSKVYYKIVNK